MFPKQNRFDIESTGTCGNIYIHSHHNYLKKLGSCHYLGLAHLRTGKDLSSSQFFFQGGGAEFQFKIIGGSPP